MTSDNLLNLSGSVPLLLKKMRVEPKLGPSTVRISENLEGKSEPLRHSPCFEMLSFQCFSKGHLSGEAPAREGRHLNDRTLFKTFGQGVLTQKKQ